MAAESGLIDRARSCLVVIDVQEFFLGRLALHEREPLAQRIGWMMRVARALDIPIVATAENVARVGPMLPELAALMPAGSVIHDKMIYGLADQADIRQAVGATGKDTFVLVGLETDVCVAQSAFGLKAAGYNPVVVDDACGTPAPHHEHGLRRLRDAGIAVQSIKGVFYEWTRDVETSRRVRAALNAPLPPGLTL